MSTNYYGSYPSNTSKMGLNRHEAAVLLSARHFCARIASMSRKDTEETRSKERVAVFIDHTNVFKRIEEIEKADGNWKPLKLYNPHYLAERMAGNRTLVAVHFYCAPPPAYYLHGGKVFEDKYWKQLSYYEEIKKLPKIDLFLARLQGGKGNLREKGLDTKLNTDLVLYAGQDKYDTALLVSNDGDYYPGLEGVKQLGKKIELAYFRGKCSMNTRQLADVSRRLRMVYFTRLNFTIKEGEAS